jgi:hypothetical protein
MNWFSEGLKSSYSRYLEAEIVRVRVERDARIRELLAEKLELLKKIDRLELALMPQYRKLFDEDFVAPAAVGSAEMSLPVDHWKQALDDHNKAQAEEEECLKNQPPKSTQKEGANQSWTTPGNQSPQNRIPSRDLTMEEMSSLARKALKVKAAQGS